MPTSRVANCDTVTGKLIFSFFVRNFRTSRGKYLRVRFSSSYSCAAFNFIFLVVTWLSIFFNNTVAHRG